MDISLTPELESFVRRQVETGLYDDASEVVREALRLMDLNEELVHQRKLELLRARLRAGEAQFASGEYITLDGEKAIDEFFASLSRED